MGDGYSQDLGGGCKLVAEVGLTLVEGHRHVLVLECSLRDETCHFVN